MLQGTLAYVSPQDSMGQSNITLQIDPGYPVTTLLLSDVTLLAISYDSATGLLSTNTSDIYLRPPSSHIIDESG